MEHLVRPGSCLGLQPGTIEPRTNTPDRDILEGRRIQIGQELLLQGDSGTSSANGVTFVRLMQGSNQRCIEEYLQGHGRTTEEVGIETGKIT